jgi:hypothetical protein
VVGKEREAMTTKAEFRVDLHSHTRGSDGHSTASEIVERAIAAGLDGLCLTDHHKVRTPESDEVAALAKKCGLKVFRGVEYSSDCGHLLLFGIDNKLVDSFGFYCNAQTVIDAVNAAGGAVVASHPFRSSSRALYEKVATLTGLAAWEGYNGQCSYRSPAVNELAVSLAKRKGRRITGGSDAHDARDLGLAYTVFPEEFDTDRGLVRALKRGGYKAVLDTKRVERLRLWLNEQRWGVSVLDKCALPALRVGSAPSKPSKTATSPTNPGARLPEAFEGGFKRWSA